MYSLGKGQNGEVILYIKRHPQGRCSQFLSEQSKGNLVQGRIISNPKFHVPKRFKSLILISNGTGIAPFMGMISENSHKGDIHLFWGGASKEDYSLYENSLMQMQKEGKITSVNTVFSEEENSYVQDLLSKNKGLITEELKRGACLMICGSLSMENAVYSNLDLICNESQLKNMDYYKSKGRLKTDCY
jgi:sulfite reductase (NADPH) flavoprotein alpha-component